MFGPWERDTGLRDTLSPHLQLAAMAREGKEAVLARGAERDWIYAPDVAHAFVRMLEAPTLPPLAMNVTQGELWPLEIMANGASGAAVALRRNEPRLRRTDRPAAAPALRSIVIRKAGMEARRIRPSGLRGVRPVARYFIGPDIWAGSQVTICGNHQMSSTATHMARK